MGLIQDLIQKYKAKKEESNAFLRQKKLEDTYEKHKINPNERLLMAFKEEERQKRIRIELERIKKKKDREVWSGKLNNPAYAKNFIAGQKNLYSGNQGNLFNDRGFFKQKNIIANQRNVVATCPNIFMSGGKR